MSTLPVLSVNDAAAVVAALHCLAERLQGTGYLRPQPWRREALFWGLSTLSPARHAAAWAYFSLVAVGHPGRVPTAEEAGRYVDVAPPDFATWEAEAPWERVVEALEAAAVLAEGSIPFGAEVDEEAEAPRRRAGLLGPPDAQLARSYLLSGAERLRENPGRSHDVGALWWLLFGTDWPSFCLAWACLRLAALRVYEPHEDPKEALSHWLRTAKREQVLHALEEAAVIAGVCPPFVIT